MIQVRVSEGLEFSITYYMEGVKVYELLTKDYSVGLDAIKAKMQLTMGLAKGKKLTSKQENLR